MKFTLVTFAAVLASLTTANPIADPKESSLQKVQEEALPLPTITQSIATLPPHWPPPPPPTSSSSSSSSSSFIITITTLPPGGVKPTDTPRPCPTVTLTTRPSGCEPIRCPIPGCTYEEEMFIPCGCAVRTLLWVEGCQTACPEGCATRTNTLSQLCVTATATLATSVATAVV